MPAFLCHHPSSGDVVTSADAGAALERRKCLRGMELGRARAVRGTIRGMPKWAIAPALLILGSAILVAGDDVALRDFLQDQKFANGWIYEDIEAGYKQAAESGKPLLVCFCCVP